MDRETVIRLARESEIYCFPQGDIAGEFDALERFAAAVEANCVPQWIDPNDKTQDRCLPKIGVPVLFSHVGKTYLGKHTGGSFKASTPPFLSFCTWDCHWMPLPSHPEPK